MRFSAFILALLLYFESFSCINHFSRLSQKSFQASEPEYLDYSAIVNLDSSFSKNNLDSIDFKAVASFILVENTKILIKNEFQPQLASNQVLCASGRFLNELNATGWNKLYVKTYQACPVLVQMYAAGVIEGLLSFREITDFYANVRWDHEKKENQLEKLHEFFKNIDQIIEKRLKNDSFFKELNQTQLNYWSQIALSKAQMLGVYSGYNARSREEKSLIDFYFINVDGQISELMDYMEYKKNIKFSKETIQTQISSNHLKTLDISSLLADSKSENLREFWIKKLRESHCSVFVKPLFNNATKAFENILVSHSTWDDYNAMVRIFKHYDFELSPNNSKYKFNLNNHKVTFSSYPGCISSTDDFYLINENLMITETTIGILFPDAYSRILPDEDYIPDFMRILLANRLSNTAQEWVDWFMLKNTGTYNSQWTVLDLNKLKNSIGQKGIEKGTILMLEQFPGQYHYEDITNYVEKNQYWASYNVPFFSEIRRESGYTQLEGEEPASFSYKNSVRGKMFANKNPETNTIEDLKHLMLYNPWNTQKLEDKKNGFLAVEYQNPAEAIGSRYDLMAGNSDNFGEIDVKACDLDMMKRHECWTISGPAHQDQPVFRFSKAQKQEKHQGLVDEWNFDWIKVSPQIMRGEEKTEAL